MLINQFNRKSKFIFIFFSLILTFSGFGQKNFISDIQLNGRSIPRLEVTLVSPDGKKSKVEIRKDTEISSESIINVPTSGITVFLTSLNGTVTQINGPSTLQIHTTKNREEYRLIQGEEGNILIEVFKELVGGVTAYGPTNRIQARTQATQFSLVINGKEMSIAVKRGIVDVNLREKFEIKDEAVLDNESKRDIYVRETSRLTKKDSAFNFKPIDTATYSLAEERDIKRFLRNQFKKQKRSILNSGPDSKAAFKDLEKGAPVEYNLAAFEKARENGELTNDFIIQSSLLFADYYFQKNDLKRSVAWLELGLDLSGKFYDSHQQILNYFQGDNELVNAFRYDMLIANEFFAWGYDLKLRINGCLERAEENPSIYRSNAKDLILKIKSDN